MKFPFYQNWFKKRFNKIISILGEDWFINKSILELGACYGDFGLEFIKMGSKVTFCDVRIKHLECIKYKLENQFPNIDGSDPNSFAKLVQLNQNLPYNFEKKYDLVLHLGTLYHIENWKQDLISALSHTNLMFLETAVNPDDSLEESLESCFDEEDFEYEAYNCRRPIFSQKHVEQVLSECGCKFIRFDDKNLNTCGWTTSNFLLYSVYDWTSENYLDHSLIKKKDEEHGTHYRRFWLILT